jgi:hypothetical protein
LSIKLAVDVLASDPTIVILYKLVFHSNAGKFITLINFTIDQLINNPYYGVFIAHARPKFSLHSCCSFFFWHKTTLEVFVLANFANLHLQVVSCPCALGLATPTAILIGTSLGNFLCHLFPSIGLMFDQTMSNLATLLDSLISKFGSIF